MASIRQFKDKHAFLSNFHPAKVIYDNIEFPTVEHAYQYAKFNIDKIKEEIRSVETPKEAKQIASRYKNFIPANFHRGKRSLMYTLCHEKFSTNDELQKQLLETHPSELVEGNYWGDTYWGVDLKTNCGANHLGKILMLVREELKNALGV
jgi:ribA/ribD-fused uncharacterized protein